MTGNLGNLGGLLNVGHYCGIFDKAGPKSDVFDIKFLGSEARDVELPIDATSVASLEWCWWLHCFMHRLTLAPQSDLNSMGPANSSQCKRLR